jgi:2-polyprenyl-3-methyl-5-hydroxy-6-metoxy-1,4-benzoquinol methylase
VAEARSEKPAETSPQSTSFAYGDCYQQDMEQFYWESKRRSAENHAWNRVQLAERLVREAASGCLATESPAATTLLDVGCSVGLLAIHFSKLGYRTIGIDFDPAAIATARKLNELDAGRAQFILGDVGTLQGLPGIDIALCFDIFEHLHDDELGALLKSLRAVLSGRGVLVFHTYPQWYDYIFSMWAREQQVRFPWPLKPFSYLPAAAFRKCVVIYALLIDIALVTLTGKTWRERIKHTSHCNPLTLERLSDIFGRADYEILQLESGFITDQFKAAAKRRFLKHQITHRSLYGIARPRP